MPTELQRRIQRIKKDPSLSESERSRLLKHELSEYLRKKTQSLSGRTTSSSVSPLSTTKTGPPSKAPLPLWAKTASDSTAGSNTFAAHLTDHYAAAAKSSHNRAASPASTSPPPVHPRRLEQELNDEPQRGGYFSGRGGSLSPSHSTTGATQNTINSSTTTTTTTSPSPTHAHVEDSQLTNTNFFVSPSPPPHLPVSPPHQHLPPLHLNLSTLHSPPASQLQEPTRDPSPRAVSPTNSVMRTPSPTLRTTPPHRSTASVTSPPTLTASEKRASEVLSEDPSVIPSPSHPNPHAASPTSTHHTSALSGTPGISVHSPTPSLPPSLHNRKPTHTPPLVPPMLNSQSHQHAPAAPSLSTSQHDESTQEWASGSSNSAPSSPPQPIHLQYGWYDAPETHAVTAPTPTPHSQTASRKSPDLVSPSSGSSEGGSESQPDGQGKRMVVGHHHINNISPTSNSNDVSPRNDTHLNSEWQYWTESSDADEDEPSFTIGQALALALNSNPGNSARSAPPYQHQHSGVPPTRPKRHQREIEDVNTFHHHHQQQQQQQQQQDNITPTSHRSESPSPSLNYAPTLTPPRSPSPSRRPQRPAMSAYSQDSGGGVGGSIPPPAVHNKQTTYTQQQHRDREMAPRPPHIPEEQPPSPSSSESSEQWDLRAAVKRERHREFPLGSQQDGYGFNPPTGEDTDDDDSQSEYDFDPNSPLPRSLKPNPPQFQDTASLNQTRESYVSTPCTSTLWASSLLLDVDVTGSTFEDNVENLLSNVSVPETPTSMNLGGINAVNGAHISQRTGGEALHSVNSFHYNKYKSTATATAMHIHQPPTQLHTVTSNLPSGTATATLPVTGPQHIIDNLITSGIPGSINLPTSDHFLEGHGPTGTAGQFVMKIGANGLMLHPQTAPQPQQGLHQQSHAQQHQQRYSPQLPSSNQGLSVSGSTTSMLSDGNLSIPPVTAPQPAPVFGMKRPDPHKARHIVQQNIMLKPKMPFAKNDRDSPHQFESGRRQSMSDSKSSSRPPKTHSAAVMVNGRTAVGIVSTYRNTNISGNGGGESGDDDSVCNDDMNATASQTSRDQNAASHESVTQYHLVSDAAEADSQSRYRHQPYKRNPPNDYELLGVDQQYSGNMAGNSGGYLPHSNTEYSHTTF